MIKALSLFLENPNYVLSVILEAIPFIVTIIVGGLATLGSMFFMTTIGKFLNIYGNTMLFASPLTLLAGGIYGALTNNYLLLIPGWLLTVVTYVVMNKIMPIP